jgi:surfactin synthase thioesterase subunit
VILHWIRRMPDAPVVICFPHAGGSVLSCLGLAAALPDDLAIATVALPRPEADRPVADAKRTAGAVAEEIALALRDQNAGLTLVGNSFGALLAFETAVALERLEAPIAERLHLVVSGFRSPSRPPCDAPLHRLPRARLLAELRECFGAVGPDLGDLFGDAQEAELRAGIEACETYRLGDAPPLRCALSVIRLLADPSVSDEECLAWRDISAGPVRFRALESGHFPWSGATAAFASLVTELIALARSASVTPEPSLVGRSIRVPSAQKS